MGKETEEVTAIKNEKTRLRRFFLNFGKLILDATKLSFGSLVLGTIIRGDFPQASVLFWGIIVSAFGAIMGLIIVSLSEEK
jgi:hypothetical protein